MPASLKTATSVSFYYTSSLKCASYLGSNDLSSIDIFHASTISSSFEIHSSVNYPYKIDSYEPIKDGKKCPEKAFSIQIEKLKNLCTCRCRCSNRAHVNALIVLLVS